MPENSWPENSFYNEADPLDELLSEWADTVDSPPLQPRSEGRRRKAFVALSCIWGITLVLHLVMGAVWLVYGLTLLMSWQTLRYWRAVPQSLPEGVTANAVATDSLPPMVSLMVAAKNEEAVIGRLVENLCRIDYPRYELWVIDDNSSDRTPEVLAALQQTYPQLKVVRRLPGAGGGKSGALNQVLPLTRGEIIGVFDADATVTPDLLQQVVLHFQLPKVGGVQVRKAISNAQINWLSQGQAAEMLLDAYYQQQRVACGGMGELRGNGQFVRRQALERCGGWNEETITDDLDLSLKLHLHGWQIHALMTPAVQEEGVTSLLALWHQRNRWGEGGYQSYLDYWQPLLRNRLGWQKSWDVFCWFLIKYAIPTATIPDFLMAIAQQRLPLLFPLTTLSLLISFVGMARGISQVQPMGLWGTLGHSLWGTLYMFHWLPVMSSTTVRMALRAKRLKWVKTVHHGA
ncbi:glycosyltransferase family 2 protein [Thermosynechococcaceae cyanobacterium Okahandja]